MPTSKPGNDATAAKRLARSAPMSGRNSRSDETNRRGHSVRDLYSLGRVYPGRQPAREPVQRQPANDYEMHIESEKPQSIEDMRDGKTYYNDHPNDWIRGANETAENKPGFDHSPPRNKMRR
jgi:hypothetical protein